VEQKVTLLCTENLILLVHNAVRKMIMCLFLVTSFERCKNNIILMCLDDFLMLLGHH